MINRIKNNGWLMFLLGLLVGGAFVYFSSYRNNATKPIPTSNSTFHAEDLFVWNPPQDDPLISPSTNITNSATCRFKKVFNTFYGPPKITNSNPKQQPDSVTYAYGNEDEKDTVTFIDLNTQQPKVKINTGEYELKVLNDNPESITLINLAGADQQNHALSAYKIFKHKGVLIYIDFWEGKFLAGPTGTLEMGYCN